MKCKIVYSNKVHADEPRGSDSGRPCHTSQARAWLLLPVVVFLHRPRLGYLKVIAEALLLPNRHKIVSRVVLPSLEIGIHHFCTPYYNINPLSTSKLRNLFCVNFILSRWRSSTLESTPLNESANDHREASTLQICSPRKVLPSIAGKPVRKPSLFPSSSMVDRLKETTTISLRKYRP